MRNHHLAAIPLAALLLTACASATDATPLTTPTPEPTATATPTPAAGDFAWLNRHDSSFNSGDAYYEMVYRNHGGLLLKTDYATAAQTVACTVPGCTHDSADCPAWFPGQYRYYCPFVADGAVYVLNATLFHTDQTWEEYREEYLTPRLDSTDLTPEELEAHYYGLWQQQSAAPQVYRLTDDGKTCIDLPAECVDYVFDFCDDAALYGVMTSGNNGQNTKAVRIDLTTGELQSVPLEPTEYFVTCYDGALLTVRYVTDAPLPDDFEQFRAAVQSATVEFDRYDPRTGERRKLIERPYNIADERLSGYLGTHNGKLYFEEREALQGGPTALVLCFKGEGGLSREEIETEIDAALFARLEHLIGKPLIHKERRGYQLPGGLTLEVNCVDPDLPTAFWYAEVEFETEAQALAWDPAGCGLADYLHEECTGKPGSSMGEYWLQTRK